MNTETVKHERSLWLLVFTPFLLGILGILVSTVYIIVKELLVRPNLHDAFGLMLAVTLVAMVVFFLVLNIGSAVCYEKKVLKTVKQVGLKDNLEDVAVLFTDNTTRKIDVKEAFVGREVWVDANED